jgi:hypothetical protein
MPRHHPGSNAQETRALGELVSFKKRTNEVRNLLRIGVAIGVDSDDYVTLGMQNTVPKGVVLPGVRLM